MVVAQSYGCVLVKGDVREALSHFRHASRLAEAIPDTDWLRADVWAEELCAKGETSRSHHLRILSFVLDGERYTYAEHSYLDYASPTAFGDVPGPVSCRPCDGCPYRKNLRLSVEIRKQPTKSKLSKLSLLAELMKRIVHLYDEQPVKDIFDKITKVTEAYLDRRRCHARPLKSPFALVAITDIGVIFRVLDVREYYSTKCVLVHEGVIKELGVS